MYFTGDQIIPSQNVEGKKKKKNAKNGLHLGGAETAALKVSMPGLSSVQMAHTAGQCVSVE